MSRVTTFLAATIASGALALTAPAFAASGHQNAKAHPAAKAAAKKPAKPAKPHDAGKAKDKKPSAKPDAKPKQDTK